MRFIYLSVAAIVLLTALLVLLLSIWLATTSSSHSLRSGERAHIQAATQFVEAFDATHARLPTGAEFEAWEKQMDAQGFRYEGNGYTLHNCGYPNLNPDHSAAPASPKFCLGFSTGNGFVTYQSWQNDKSVASFDDSSVPFMLFLSWLAAASLLGFATWLFRLASVANPPLNDGRAKSGAPVS